MRLWGAVCAVHGAMGHCCAPMGRGLCCAWSYGAQLCVCGVQFALCAAYGGTAVHLWGAVCAVRGAMGHSCGSMGRSVCCVPPMGHCCASMGLGLHCAWSYGALLCVYGARCVLCAAYGAQLWIYGARCVLCMELWGTAVHLWGTVCAVQHL